LGTHIAGVAFAYAPGFPGYVMLEIPSDVVAQMIAESEKAALAAIERFDAAARRSLVSAEHRLFKSIGSLAPLILSTLARRFDLGVLMQSEPNGVDNDDMIETSLFQSGRHGGAVHPEGWAKARPCGVLLGRQPRGGARHQRRATVIGQGNDRRPADRAERKDQTLHQT
jgi:hypothetical protein